MSVKEDVLAALKELVLPELQILKQEQGEIKISLASANQRLDDLNRRLDDLNAHLVDQSRRIDAFREELGGRIDETNKRLDHFYADILKRFDETNKRLDRLYEVIVRREEHQDLAGRVRALEQEVAEL